MQAPEIEVLGQRLKPLEPVAVVGDLLGLGRGAAFRAAADWPTTGPAGARKVVLPALLDRLDIPFRVISDTEGCYMGDDEVSESRESEVSAGQDGQESECPRDCVSVTPDTGVR